MIKMVKCDICKNKIKKNSLGIKSFFIYQLQIDRYSDQGNLMPGNNIFNPIKVKVCPNCNKNEKIIKELKNLFCKSI